MKLTQCTPTNHEGISNDTESAAKGAMVWEIARVQSKKCHSLGDLQSGTRGAMVWEISMWQTSKTNKLGSFLDKFHNAYVI
jgi:hypothetical protein